MTTLLTLLLIPLLTTALPLQPRAAALTATTITHLDPLTSTCANPPAAGECRTAAQAAPYISISFTNFGITSFGEQAALLALMLYESAGFKYSRNHFPGVEGQGTRNMYVVSLNCCKLKFILASHPVRPHIGENYANPPRGERQSPTYNREYATYLSTTCSNCGIATSALHAAEAQGPAAVLKLVNTDEWSFGSAAWFLATQCDAGVREGLRQGTEEGWEAYLVGCVGTSASEERTEIWRRAVGFKRW